MSAAKADPGKLTYATPGVGTPHHLSMALFLQSTGTEMLHVPYKGTAGAVTDLLGGRIDYMFLPAHVALQHIQAGKLKAIATGSSKRVPQLPDVPTLAEAGVTADNVDMWYGVLAPRARRRTSSHASTRKSPRCSSCRKSRPRSRRRAWFRATSTADEFGALIAKDAQRWATVVERGGITAE